MFGGYVLVAGILYYIFLVRKLDESGMHFFKAANMFIGGYIPLQIVLSALLYTAMHLPVLENVLTPSSGLTFVFQYLAALVVFFMMERDGDSYLSYALWGGFGIFLIFIAAPQSGTWLSSLL